jgi:putative addiction module component (TIGR02574 family)
MTKAAEQLLNAVMQLEPDDRAELVDRLEESLEPSQDPAYVAAWEAEIRERIASVERGAERPIPWREAMDQIRQGVIDGE